MSHIPVSRWVRAVFLLVVLLHVVMSTIVLTDSFWQHVDRAVMHVPLAPNHSIMVQVVPVRRMDGLDVYVYGSTHAWVVPDTLHISVRWSDTFQHVNHVFVGFLLSWRRAAVLPLILPCICLLAYLILRFAKEHLDR